MLSGPGSATLLLISARSLRRALIRLGGPGLIPLALLDNSPIPIPGAMDIATIILAARQPDLWLYYALMAALGSLIGGYITYRLARKGGKKALEHRITPHRFAQVVAIFERWGFSAIAIPALLPPPVPMVPFVFAAGAMQYPAKKFLSALALGRTARYTILAFLGAHYRRAIIAFIVTGSHPILVGVVVAAIIVAVLATYLWPASWRRDATHASS
jgi:membrane protein YqaA with SNARE-associated domain